MTDGFDSEPPEEEPRIVRVDVSKILPPSKKKKSKPTIEAPEKQYLTKFDLKKMQANHEVGSWVIFVAENMLVKHPKKKDCPSPGAWALLMKCRENEEIQREFYRLTLPKLLPNKSQMESIQKRQDDGRTISIIDKLLASESQKGGDKLVLPVSQPFSAEPPKEGTY